MKRISVSLKFNGSGYVAKPFWPETNTLINISKDVHPKLGDAKKAAALLAACEKRGITQEEYARIEAKSAYPFYTVDDARDSEIVIPPRVFHCFLNDASQNVPKAIPSIKSKGLTFIGIKFLDGPFRTGKTVADAKTFSRFVKLPESNQRSFQEDMFIDDFTARTVITLDEETALKSEDLKKLVEYAGRLIGIGSSRPQGYGRFTVVGWDKL